MACEDMLMEVGNTPADDRREHMLQIQLATKCRRRSRGRLSDRRRFGAGELVEIGHVAARLNEQVTEEDLAGRVRRAMKDEHVIVFPDEGAANERTFAAVLRADRTVFA